MHTTFAALTFWLLIQISTGLLTTFTPANSRWRLAGFWWLLLMAYVYGCQGLRPTGPLGREVAAHGAILCLANILNAADLLLISRADYGAQRAWKRRPHQTGIRHKLRWAVEIPFNLRRIGTPWQTQRYGSGNPPRARFVCQRLFATGFLIALCRTICAMASPVVSEATISKASQTLLWPVDGISMAAVRIRVTVTLCTWIVTGAIHRALYNLASCVFVVTGIHAPTDWPELGGSVLQCYSIRQFWGDTWHQLFRKLLTANCDFLAFSVLRLPRMRVHTRYCRLYLVFALSGLLHLCMDLARRMPVAESGSLRFFILQAVGITLEDGVTWVRRQLGYGTKFKVASQVVGYVWVILFLAWTTPVWVYPMLRDQHQTGALVPSPYVFYT